MAIDDCWYKNAVLYCLNVSTYMDVNGDGILHVQVVRKANRTP